MAITESSGRTVYRAGSLSSDPESRVRGESPALQFSGGSGAWSDGGAGGTFSPSSGATATYTPANRTQSVIISNSGTYTIQIYGTLPIYAQVGFDTEYDVDTKIKKSRTGKIYSREDGDPETEWMFGWEDRDLTQRNELAAFWKWHRKIRDFYVIDSEAAFRNLVRFTTSMKFKGYGSNRWAAAAGVKGFTNELSVGTILP